MMIFYYPKTSYILGINPAKGLPEGGLVLGRKPSRFITFEKRKTTTSNAAIMKSIFVKFAEFICIPRLLMVIYTKA
jgi:hypothetical protein